MDIKGVLREFCFLISHTIFKCHKLKKNNALKWISLVHWHRTLRPRKFLNTSGSSIILSTRNLQSQQIYLSCYSARASFATGIRNACGFWALEITRRCYQDEIQRLDSLLGWYIYRG